MTYWPISAPSVYAASKHRSPKECAVTSDDGLKQAVLNSPPMPAGVLYLNSQVHNEGDQSQNSSQNGQYRGDPVQEQAADMGGKDAPMKVNGYGPEGRVSDFDASGQIVGLRVTRSGHMFATITKTTLTIWQTKPTAILASIMRSELSLKTYGPNVSLLLRPDSAIFVVQTSLSFLITYSLATDPTMQIYKPQFTSSGSGHARRRSASGYTTHRGMEANAGSGEGGDLREVSLRFRMVIKVDAGIVKALALDDELIVATERPAAIQCIRWAPDSTGNQTRTELLSRMQWIGRKVSVIDMVHDRPMNLSTWISSDGRAFAVQRIHSETKKEVSDTKGLFKGYAFHIPQSDGVRGQKAAINARFSLIAIGCKNGDIHVYTARDYMGNIPISHKLRPSVTTASTGKLNFLIYSPDGYSLFAGYENGWMMWSVYGKPGASSFSSDRSISKACDEGWLLGVDDGFWVGGGSQIIMLGQRDNRLWFMEMARSAVTGCFTSANVFRSLLQTSSGFMIYRGYDLPDLTAISAEVSLWHHVQVPSHYIGNQWPIRSAVISWDGRYVAVAGRRGLAHYSISSGRWKTFEDPLMENEFTVRGGMCWHQHVLIAAVESLDAHEVRIYSREQALDSNPMHVETLPAPIVLIAPSGDDSLLVYTYENILYHYIITVENASVKLVQVGQIALHGIIRAPPRVRALSWLLPEEQLYNGEPSQDVAVASILFLVDAKLVLLQPSTTEEGDLKYEMRIIAQNVEYYTLIRDQPSFHNYPETSGPPSPTFGSAITGAHGHDLRDSLWLFDGQDMRVWIDVQDVLASASGELGRDLPTAVKVMVDFYPLSTLLNKGILFGVESELVQRRDINFGSYRFSTRTHLFIPPMLRHHLSQYNSPAALHLSHRYQHLLYFPHALEILLHDVLDEEVDSPPPPEQALLPSVLSFLSSFPQFLDIVVQCTRKTELRSWRTLFAHLPPPQELFEESLQRGSLKTAGGYLLVLHTLEELSSSSHQLIRLLQRAKAEQDWDLCKELARFLMALDETGSTLCEALELVELRSPVDKEDVDRSFLSPGSRLAFPRGRGSAPRATSSRSSSQSPRGTESRGAPADYFSSGAEWHKV